MRESLPENTMFSEPKTFAKSFIVYFFMLLLSALLLTTVFTFAAEPEPEQAQEPAAPRSSNLPVISIAPGVFYFLGDVGYSHLNQPFNLHSGFQIEVQKHSDKNLSFALFLMSGHVSGEGTATDQAVNFRSSILSEGLMLRYDFNSRTHNHQVLTPYITGGIEYVFFNPRSDLKDADGNTYHNWSDGTIRNISENDTSGAAPLLLHRDYKYETALRDANVDGQGRFRASALGFPLGAGVRFRISSRCSMNFSSVCHIIQSDQVDGVTSKGRGDRQGNSRNDKFFFSSVSFRYDLSAPRDVVRKHSNDYKVQYDDVKNVDFDKMAKDDADNDGVPDIRDESSATPLNVRVDANGVALDTDGDGIPDFRDKEENTAYSSLVNEDGVTITEEMIQEQLRKDSLAALPAVIEYIHAVDRQSKLEGFRPGTQLVSKDGSPEVKVTIPSAYVPIDTDNNGVISPKEISSAIDDYLKGSSRYSVKEFYDLIDFFFKQK